MLAESLAAARGAFPSLLHHFPSVSHVFAYGSGIFPQPGLYPAGGKNRPMIDLIFSVPDAREWHMQVRTTWEAQNRLLKRYPLFSPTEPVC
jgi:hypothetical protein